MKKYILYLIAIACILFTDSKSYAQTTLGTDFWLSFGQNSVNSADMVDLQVRIVAGTATKVTFTFTGLPGASRTIDIPENTVYTLSLNNAEKNAVYLDNSSILSKKSLHITSDKPVTVYALNCMTVSSDATNVLPTNVLGKEYFHISYNSTSDAMVFVAPEDNTSVSYNLKGNIFSKKLNRGDVWYVVGTSDMTGAHITSDKPIAYFAACKTAMIPNSAHANSDNLFQQIPPVNSWGTRFLVPDIGVSAQYPLLVRVIASQDGTSFTHIGGQLREGSKATLNKGEFATLLVSMSGCFISSNKPVGVCSFLLSYGDPYDKDDLVGGPAEVWIPPIEQSMASITISSFFGAVSKIDQHYALIVTPANTCQNTTVTIDGETTTVPDSWITQSGYAFTLYYLSKNVPYTFSNQEGLTVLIAGLGPSESYYYLGGSSMRDLDMSFSVNGTDYRDILGKAVCSEKIALKATIRNAHSSSGFLKWYIDDSLANAATDKMEWDTTLASGIHQIKMVVRDMSGTEQSISASVNIDTPVASITGSTEITTGTTTTLSPTSGGTWKSSNTAIATVSNSGVVTGVSEGKARFTFTSTAGCSAVTDTVTVRKTMSVHAVNDTVSVIHNNSISFDALANDIFTCSKNQVSIDTVAGSGLHYGSLVINSDKTFTYKADKGFGIDSVEYSVTCETDTVKAKIYFVVSKSLSKKYTACENAKFSIGMHPITGVEYFWYDSNNTLIDNTARNDIIITKNASPSQSFYAEARYRGKTLGRIESKVVLSDNCGLVNPVGCAVDGQLLFREDFGGNSVSDGRICLNALPVGVTDYKFKQTDELNSNEYALVKHIDPNSSRAWQTDFSDHTNPDDKNRGYMFLADASADARKIYETRITGLCDNINKLYFSAWATNVIPAGNSATDDPVLKFELSDDKGNVVETYVTSNIPRDPNGKVKWRNYGFMFNPQGYGSLILKVYNNGQGAGGNDFAMDDIEVRFCVPQVITDISKDTVKLCQGEKFSINASFTDVGDFGNNLIGRWQRSMVNDFHGTWTTVEEIKTGNSILTSTFNIDSVNPAKNKGYYRLIVGNSSTIDHPNCIVSSNVIYLHIDSLPQTPVISSLYGNYTLCGNVNTLTLEIKNPGKDVSYQWYKNNSALQSQHGMQLLVNSPGMYKVSSTSTTTGCSSSSEIKIDQDTNINFPNPVISSVSGGNVICGSEGSVFLSLNNKNDYGSNVAYQWYKDGQIINNATSANYNVTTEGEYHITVKLATCLAVSASIKVTDSSSGGTVISPVLKSENDVTDLCTGGSVRLYVSNSSSYTSMTSYVWYRGDTEVLRGTGKSSYIASVSGKYKVLAYETNGCSSLSGELELKQGSGAGITKPAIESESGSYVICGNQGGIMLKLTTVYTETNISYQWFKGDTLLAGATGIYYYAKEAGKYSILVTVDKCSSVSDIRTVTKDASGIVISPVLKSENDVTDLCTGGSVRLYVSNTSSYTSTTSYVWYRGDTEVLRGAGKSSYIASVSGKYKVLAYETNGCSSLSNELELKQGSGAGITKPAIESESGGYVICGNQGGIMLKLTTVYTETNISYQWFKGDTLLAGATGIYYYAKEAGKYSLLVTADKCSSVSDIRTVTKDASGTVISPVLKS
ncbi:MAG: Ig-like domain-containing protein, partial [Prevotellaceae bacterium]|nr:Ig-like domain-containing protein [Prevotellaceae bacterium]